VVHRDEGEEEGTAASGTCTGHKGRPETAGRVQPGQEQAMPAMSMRLQ
jgi:hypothetical protein